MEQCHFCGNRNFRETTCQYTYKRDDRFLIVDQVPCSQCDYCGEQYFAADVLKKIEREFESIHLHGKEPQRKLVIPVEQFWEIQRAS